MRPAADRRILALLLASALVPAFLLACGQEEGPDAARQDRVEAFEERLAAAGTERESRAAGTGTEAAREVDRTLAEAEQAIQEAREASDEEWRRSREEIDEILSEVETQLAESDGAEDRG